MATLSTDTHPDAEEIQLQLFRAAPPWRKLRLAAEMTATVVRLTSIGLKRRNPRASEAELRRMLADVLLGPELGERVYGPSACKDGQCFPTRCG